jgi:hypothetical protein
MERLIVLRCPSLAREGQEGEELRRFAEVLTTVVRRCPFVQPVRLGLAVLPARAPSRFFGGERAVCDLLTDDLSDLLGDKVSLGAADGLFAATLAARGGLIVPAEGSAEFLAHLSMATLRRPELAATCQRLGVSTLGRFARLDVDRVIERFGTEGVHCHRVASGLEGELDGLRDPTIQTRLAALDEPPPLAVQPTFFGGTSLATERAQAAAWRVQRRFHPSMVQVARLRAGHDPSERAVLVPFASIGDLGTEALAPWPGQIPAPSPMTVLSTPEPVELVDPAGTPVTVDGRGLLTGVPGRIHLARSPRPDEVAAWAGPWPLTTRWWGDRRRRARLQVVTSSGVALLLGAEHGRWWMLGRYD